MKLITRDTDYALRGICFIAQRKGATVSVSELVQKLKIPRPFLRKLLQILNREGLLISYKGQGGGFILGRKTRNILLVDLIKIFQGSLKLNECLLKNRGCPNMRTCRLKKKIDAIEKYVLNQLKTITVASLVK